MTEQPLTVVFHGPGVLISPQAAKLFVSLLEGYARAERVPLSPAADRLRCELRTFLRQLEPDCGPADVRSTPQPAPSETWISVKAAAPALGVTARHASRLARDGLLGPSRVHRGARLVLSDEVALAAAERRPA